MARPELGKKHTCAGCGAKFYDLNKSPAICPKCGEEQAEAVAPASKTAAKASVPKPEEKTKDDAVVLATDDPKDDDDEDGDEIDEALLAGVAIDGDDDDDDDAGEDDNTFLEDDDEEGKDVSGIIGGGLAKKED